MYITSAFGTDDMRYLLIRAVFRLVTVSVEIRASVGKRGCIEVLRKVGGLLAGYGIPVESESHG